MKDKKVVEAKVKNKDKLNKAIDELQSTAEEVIAEITKLAVHFKEAQDALMNIDSYIGASVQSLARYNKEREERIEKFGVKKQSDE